MWQQSSYRDRDLKKNCQYKHWGPESDSRITWEEMVKSWHKTGDLVEDSS